MEEEQRVGEWRREVPEEGGEQRIGRGVEGRGGGGEGSGVKGKGGGGGGGEQGRG